MLTVWVLWAWLELPSLFLQRKNNKQTGYMSILPGDIETQEFIPDYAELQKNIPGYVENTEVDSKQLRRS